MAPIAEMLEPKRLSPGFRGGIGGFVPGAGVVPGFSRCAIAAKLVLVAVRVVFRLLMACFKSALLDVEQLLVVGSGPKRAALVVVKRTTVGTEAVKKVDDGKDVIVDPLEKTGKEAIDDTFPGKKPATEASPGKKPARPRLPVRNDEILTRPLLVNAAPFETKAPFDTYEPPR
jgi:hypothetical protein